MCLPSALDDSTEMKAGVQEQYSDQYIHENCDEALFRPVITGCNVVIDTIDPVADDVCLRDKTVTVCINESTEKALLKSSPIINKEANVEYDRKAEENLRHAEEEKLLEDLNYQKLANKTRNSKIAAHTATQKSNNDCGKKNNAKKQKNKTDNNSNKKDARKIVDAFENKSEGNSPQNDKVRISDKQITESIMIDSVKYQGLKPEEIVYPKKNIKRCSGSNDVDVVENSTKIQNEEASVSTQNIDVFTLTKDISNKLECNVNDDNSDFMKSDSEFPALKPKPRNRRNNKKNIVETNFTLVEATDLPDVHKKSEVELETFSEHPACDAISQSIIEAEIISTHNADNSDEESIQIINKIPYDSSNLVLAFCVEPESPLKLDIELTPETILEIDDALDNCSTDLNVAGQQDSDYKSLDTEFDDMYMSMDPEYQIDKISRSSDDKIVEDNNINEEFVEIKPTVIEKTPELSTDSDDSEKLLKNTSKLTETIKEDYEIWSSKIDNVENNPINIESKALPVVQNDIKQSYRKKNKKKKKN